MKNIILFLLLITSVNGYVIDLKIESEDNNCLIRYDLDDRDYRIKGFKTITKEFEEFFVIDCDKNAESMTVNVYDNSSNRIYYDSFTNINKTGYNPSFISKEYNVIAYFYDDYNVSNNCYLKTDDIIIKKMFSKNTKHKNKYLENKVGKDIKIYCDFEVKEVLIFIDNREWNKNAFNKFYNNTKSIDINVNKSIRDIHKVEKKIKINKIPKKKVKQITKLPVKPILVQLPENMSICTVSNIIIEDNLFSEFFRLR